MRSGERKRRANGNRLTRTTKTKRYDFSQDTRPAQPRPAGDSRPRRRGADRGVPRPALPADRADRRHAARGPQRGRGALPHAGDRHGTLRARSGPLPLLRRLRPHRAPVDPLHERLPHGLAHARGARRPPRRPLRAVRRRGGAARNPPLLPRLAPAARGFGRRRRLGRDGARRHGQRQLRLRPLRRGFHRLAAPCRRRGRVGSRDGEHGRGAGDLLRGRGRAQDPHRLRHGGLLGGLFAASRAVDRTFFERHRVDLWVPGAPCHPMVFIDGIRTLLGKKKNGIEMQPLRVIFASFFKIGLFTFGEATP